MINVTWALSSCVMLLAVIALRAFLGRRMRPGLRYALWGLVLLRLLIPGTIGSAPWSVAATVRQASETNTGALAAAAASYDLPRETFAQARREAAAEYEAAGLDLSRLDESDLDARAYARMSSGVTVGKLLQWLWLAGVCGTAGVFLASNTRLLHALKKRRRPLPVPCPLPVYEAEGLGSSCLLGNTIYVSPETASDETRLRHVLAHELSHHRHGDHIWVLLRCAALALHWYDPLVWYAASLARQDSELFADAGALKHLGEDERTRYGATLIELSARRPGTAPLLCAATAMYNGKRSLRERVTMIARQPRTTAAVVIAVLCLAAVAAGCTFAGTMIPETDGIADADGVQVLTPGITAAETHLYYYDETGLQDDVDGALALTADENLAALLSLTWEEAEPLSFTEQTEDLHIALEAGGRRLTAYRDGRRVLLEANGQALWLRTELVEERTFDRAFGALADWYRDAHAAQLHRRHGMPLTGGELTDWRAELETIRGEAVNPVTCFFTSSYDDARDLDLIAFLAYCPLAEDDVTDAEFDALDHGWMHGDHRASLIEMPVPVHRYRVSRIDELLTRYAGVTVDELNVDWRHDERTIYSPDLNAFYNFTSDFGPGFFYPRYGEREGDVVTLWADYAVLRLRVTEDGYHILSHLRTRAAAEPVEALLQALCGELAFPLDVSQTRAPLEVDGLFTLRSLTADDTADTEEAAFALLDLDGDGAVEAVFRRGDYRGFYVLRWWESRVYGYEFNYRGMMSLKEDGTFFASGGASDNGAAHLHFDGAAMSVEPVFWQRGDSRTVNGLPADRESFLRAEAAQNEKKDVRWLPCTAESIDALYQ